MVIRPHLLSVGMPWRVLTYKALNTFIDDLFAFIVPMPILHRIACFRDDVVFFIFLYQRWIYAVDVTRVNEFGQSFSEDTSADTNNSVATASVSATSATTEEPMVTTVAESSARRRKTKGRS